MNKLKLSVIGTGHLGNIHVKLLKQNSEAELIGIFDNDRKRAEEISNEYKVKNFGSIEEAIKESDAVIIAASTTAHFEIGKSAIENGKHLFIEKPITENYKQAEELCKLADSKGIMIQVGHVERFNPALASLKDYSLNPRFVESHRLAQFKTRATDVSVIHDLMIHDIDIVLNLIDSKVKSIDANGVSVLTHTTDICNARLNFENGAVANLTASRISARPMRKMRFFQQDTYISCDFSKPDVEIYRILDSTEDSEKENMIPAAMLGSIEEGEKNRNIYFVKPEMPQLNAIAEEHKSFIKAVRGEGEIPVKGKDAAEALRIAEEISKMV